MTSIGEYKRHQEPGSYLSALPGAGYVDTGIGVELPDCQSGRFLMDVYKPEGESRDPLVAAGGSFLFNVTGAENVLQSLRERGRWLDAGF